MMPCTMTILSTIRNSLNCIHWTNFSKLWMISNMFVSFHWLSTNTWYSLFCCPQSKEKLCLKAGSALATLIYFIYLFILHFIHSSLLQVTEALFLMHTYCQHLLLSYFAAYIIIHHLSIYFASLRDLFGLVKQRLHMSSAASF